MSEIQITSVEQFKKETVEFDGVCLIDFWAPRCSPCKMLGPIIEKIAEKYKDNPKVKVIKVDIEQNQDIAGALQIQSIPTVHIVNKGKLVDQIVGIIQGSEYVKKIDALIKD